MVIATGWADTLIDLLDRQRAIYLQLQGFSHRQTQLIDAGDAEALLSLLDERQRLIDQIMAISREVEPFRQRWPALWASLDEPAKEELKTHIDAVQAMLDRILRQDEQDRAALTEHRRRIAQQMTALHRGTSAHQVYRSSPIRPTDSRFTDQRG